MRYIGSQSLGNAKRLIEPVKITNSKITLQGLEQLFFDESYKSPKKYKRPYIFRYGIIANALIR